MSTANVKLLDPPGHYQSTCVVPVRYLSPVPPSKPGQNAVILVGPFRGQIAKLRELEDDNADRWLVSAGNCHFEIDAEHMARLYDIDSI